MDTLNITDRIRRLALDENFEIGFNECEESSLRATASRESRFYKRRRKFSVFKDKRQRVYIVERTK